MVLIITEELRSKSPLTCLDGMALSYATICESAIANELFFYFAASNP
ncbi:MAG: hypothetical protein VKJ46_15060 [Leptolyngbyaceae bacterium]|nr:hypothetical protein [Leptolyngbyaceae bacterium]